MRGVLLNVCETWNPVGEDMSRLNVSKQVFKKVGRDVLAEDLSKEELIWRIGVEDLYGVITELNI